MGVSVDNEIIEEDEDGIVYAPLERSFDRIYTPFEKFLHYQTGSSLLLIAATLMALGFANSMFASVYYDFTHMDLSLTLGTWTISHSLHHWVNDGLMAFFFFVVGLELKREILVGELASIKKAVLPVLAAIGGMVVPASVYLFFNSQGAGVDGWAVPMATDIAFAIGVMVLLGNRVPSALFAFLVALAIADDLGAVIVIALFYTGDIAIQALWWAGGIFAALLFLNVTGVRRAIPYFILAVCLWLALLYSGLHPTLAGVLGAFSVPVRPRYDPVYFRERAQELLDKFGSSYGGDANIITNISLRAIVNKLEETVYNVVTPLHRLEHIWHLPVAYFVVPVFAFFNAGIPLQLSSMGDVVADPVYLGIVCGLVGGKFIGVAGICWLALKLRLAQLPRGTRFSQIAGVSLLAGIGFTMSIFIAQLAFAGNEDLLLVAKTAILSASLLAGIGGYFWLYIVGGDKGKASKK